MFTHTLRRLSAAVLLGGALVVTPVMATSASAGTEDCGYELPQQSTTTVTIEGSGFERGETFTVTADVEVGGVPATGGVVTFDYADQGPKDVAVSGGSASTTFVADTETPVTAVYSGVCIEGSAGISGSDDSDTPDILGVEGTSGGGSSSGGSSSGGISGADSGLGGTGMDTQTELYGLLGLGLVAVGGLTLMVHRRREQA